ncbi:ABC efflux pump, inner membrane subunit [Candidatus Koribacter versatilis Ellin345]|uniref:ABC efflux pump, inner membrane subunit n=1 Tax=Koribacter versatilis (strain Ellin345) TaxID=204669 RepID=Q1IKJ5_KORVE|nr:ABC transporter permease [Candidatus Koribacter versatilis]ABF42605.1 ABC efflux pump, inner membrane subunit [Candidatus Koribacter versatilis Ellin345]
MKFTAYLRSVYAKFFHREEVGEELELELRSHVEMRADDLERSGMSRAEAERRARIEFGSRERVREESHVAMGGNFFDVLLQDLRYSVRVLRKSPGFTIAAVMTLALAIGANAVVFSVTNAFLIKPLNVPNPESLYQVLRADKVAGGYSYLNYQDLRDRNRTFEDLAAYDIATAAFDTGGKARPSWVILATGNYFDALQMKPYLGEYFHDRDERGPNSAPYVVLSYSFWHTQFQDDRTVIGRKVRLNKHAYTVIGVAQPNFRGVLMFFNPDIFVPFVQQEQIEGQNTMNARGKSATFMVIGHLKSGITKAQAAADLNTIGAYLHQAFPADVGEMKFDLGRPNFYGDYLGRPVHAFLTGLSLLAALILLASCANLGSLFSARASDRSREMALRLALGSSRRRLLRSLFTEAVLISLAGGTLGVTASIFLLRGLTRWQPFDRWPLQVTVDPDARVYIVSLLIALAAGFIFGAVPVRQVLQTDPYGVIKAGTAQGSKRRITMRDVLVVVQIAICGVLVTSSLVALRGLERSLHADFGFEPQHRVMAELDLNMAGYKGDAVPATQKKMIDALMTIPGVQAAGSIDSVPLGDTPPYERIFAENEADLRPGKEMFKATLMNVTPGYLKAAGTVMFAGRDFTWADDKNAPQAAIVNRQFAERVFGSIDKAIGGHFKFNDGALIQVVGVIQNGKYENLTEPWQPGVFRPTQQSPAPKTVIIVHSDRDALEVQSAIRAKLREIDSELPVFTETWYKELDASLFAPRMATLALCVLGTLGSMLAVTGVFGMAAYSVSKRLRELGIRLALGARRQELVFAALGRAFKLMCFGSAAGLVLGILASKVLAFVFFEANSHDPLTLTLVVVAMALLGMIATWIPAQRSLSVDPMMLLREE